MQTFFFFFNSLTFLILGVYNEVRHRQLVQNISFHLANSHSAIFIFILFFLPKDEFVFVQVCFPLPQKSFLGHHNTTFKVRVRMTCKPYGSHDRNRKALNGCSLSPESPNLAALLPCSESASDSRGCG